MFSASGNLDSVGMPGEVLTQALTKVPYRSASSASRLKGPVTCRTYLCSSSKTCRNICGHVSHVIFSLSFSLTLSGSPSLSHSPALSLSLLTLTLTLTLSESLSHSAALSLSLSLFLSVSLSPLTPRSSLSLSLSLSFPVSVGSQTDGSPPFPRQRWTLPAGLPTSDLGGGAGGDTWAPILHS